MMDNSLTSRAAVVAPSIAMQPGAALFISVYFCHSKCPITHATIPRRKPVGPTVAKFKESSLCSFNYNEGFSGIFGKSNVLR